MSAADGHSRPHHPHPRGSRPGTPRARRRGEETSARARSPDLTALPAIAVALFLVIEGGVVFALGPVRARVCLPCTTLRDVRPSAPVRLAGFLALAALLARRCTATSTSSCSSRSRRCRCCSGSRCCSAGELGGDGAHAAGDLLDRVRARARGAAAWTAHGQGIVNRRTRRHVPRRHRRLPRGAPVRAPPAGAETSHRARTVEGLGIGNGVRGARRVDGRALSGLLPSSCTRSSSAWAYSAGWRRSETVRVVSSSARRTPRTRQPVRRPRRRARPIGRRSLRRRGQLLHLGRVLVRRADLALASCKRVSNDCSCQLRLDGSFVLL